MYDYRMSPQMLRYRATVRIRALQTARRNTNNICTKIRFTPGDSRRRSRRVRAVTSDFIDGQRQSFLQMASAATSGLRLAGARRRRQPRRLAELAISMMSHAFSRKIFYEASRKVPRRRSLPLRR
jgi:hypothetical protein